MPNPIVVMEASEAWRGPLASRLDAHSAVADADALARNLPEGPTVVVLGPSCSKERTLAGAADVIRARDDVNGLLIADRPTPDIMGAALEAGVRDILPATADITEIQDAVDRLLVVRPPRPDDDAAFTMEAAPAGGGAVTTFLAGKGGVGTTTLATNLAILRAQEESDDDRPVVLADLDLQFGDAAVMLHHTPAATVVDAVGLLGHNDAATIQNILGTHDSGLRLLPAPTELSTADLDARDLRDTLRLLQTSSRHTIVDTPTAINPATLSAVGQATHIVVVASLEMTAMRATAQIMQTFRMLSVPSDRIHLVVNGVRPRSHVEIGAVEKSLHLKVDVFVPYHDAIDVAVNTGVPVAVSAPKSKYMKAVRELADLLDRDAEAGRRRPSPG